jgi:hypothetical protein
MRNHKRATLFGCALAAPALLLSGAAFAQRQVEPERTGSFTGTLAPLNRSGVSGTFQIEQKGQGQIRVSIQATGLQKGPGPHLAHIHGRPGNANATCPTQADDTDRDTFVELEEGLPRYGAIIVNFGDVDPDDDGDVNYSKTFNLNQASTFHDGKTKRDLLPLHLREIVLHGMSVGAVGQGTPGEVDGTAGYKVVLPVACGAIQQAPR